LKRLKIAYLSSDDPHDRRSWSGTHFFIAQALQKHCGDVVLLGPIKPTAALIGKACSKTIYKATGKRYLYTHSAWLSRMTARIAERKLSKDKFDLIFTAAGSVEIANLATSIPIIYLSDATVSLISNYYPEFSNILPFSLSQADRIERSAIKKAAALIYPSRWAARSAIEDYHADVRRLTIVPFGANLEEVPERHVVLAKKRSEHCRLLFVGVDWYRKGGEIAFRTMLELEQMGLPTELTVVGCVPPEEFRHKRLKVIPFLNKNKPSDRTFFSNLFLESDFLVLPTRMECTAIAFSEASAFGLPIMATDTGGVCGAVTNGDNGYLFPSWASAAQYADMIYQIYSDRQLYSDLQVRSRNAFEERLNWNSWAKTVKGVMAAVA